LITIERYDQWIADLRGEQFVQIKGELGKPESNKRCFCGVLQPEVKEVCQWTGKDCYDSGEAWIQIKELLPEQVWLMWKDNDGVEGKPALTFPELADRLEALRPELFKENAIDYRTRI